MSCKKVNKTSKADSVKLRQNMKEPPPKEIPPCNSHAHHIVAGNDKRASKARSKLDELGIDINDKKNGVFLPGSNKDKEVFKGDDKDKFGDIIAHSNIHTDKYFKEIDDLLEEVTTVEEATEVLREIEQSLWNGTFPY